MTFSEHLEELRGRMIISLIAFVAVFLVAFAIQDPLLRFFTRPFQQAVAEINADLRKEWAKGRHVHEKSLAENIVDVLEAEKIVSPAAIEALKVRAATESEHDAPQLPTELQAVGLGESFAAYMRVCTLAAALVSAPIFLFQLWRFIGAGLYDHERSTVLRVLPWSIALFFVGLGFGFFVLAKMSAQFLMSYGEIDVVRPQPAVGPYFNLLFLLLLVMGLVFQIPLVMTVLSSVGMVGPKWFRSKRRHCILAIFVIAAVITPPDYVSQLLVAGPMLVLFEAGILLATRAEVRRATRLAGAAEKTKAGPDATKP